MRPAAMLRYGLAVALALPALGCPKSVPDIQPFAERSGEMSAGLEDGFDQTRELLAQADVGSEQLAQLESAWGQTTLTMDAIAAYSAVLADVAAAGASGKEAAGAVADAMDGMLGVIGLGPIPSALSNAFGELNRRIAMIRARNSLAQAVETAQPAVDVIAEVVSQNLSDLEELVVAAGTEIDAEHEIRHQLMANYYRALEKSQNEILRILTLILDYEAGDDEALQSLLTEDRMLRETVAGQTEIESSDVQQRADHWMRMVRARRDEMNRYRTDYELYVARSNEIRTLTDDARASIKRAAVAVKAWAQAHARLSLALQ